MHRKFAAEQVTLSSVLWLHQYHADITREESHSYSNLRGSVLLVRHVPASTGVNQDSVKP